MSEMVIGQPTATSVTSASPVEDIKAIPLRSTSVSKWLQALELFDASKPEQALEIFSQITPTNSKITYNIASIYSILGNYPQAISCFKKATSFDSYMAISHFQIGVSRFLAGSYGKAATSFNTALKLLRGNTVVNYQQLGLDYKLYSCEIVYNRALSYIYSGELATGVFDLGFATKEKKYIPEHNIIDEALTHFSEMEKSQNELSEEARENVPQLPGALDVRKQRFSVVNPPKNLQIFNLAENSPSASSEIFKKEETPAPWKEMSYSLFSVPQGSLFRLTEIKVRSILNDKSLGEMMSHGASNTAIANTSPNHNEPKHFKQGSFGRLNFLASSSSSSPSTNSNKEVPSKGAPLSTNKAPAAAGVLTPPVSPDISSLGNGIGHKQEPGRAKTTSPAKQLAATSYMELVEDTRNLLITSNSQKNTSSKYSHMQKSVSADTSASSIPSPSEPISRSTSLGNALNGNHHSINLTKSHSGSSGSYRANNGKHSGMETSSRKAGRHGYEDRVMATPNFKSPTAGNVYNGSRTHTIDSSSNYGSPSSSRVSLAHQSNTTIKIKIFCGNETRAIKAHPGMSFNELRSRIASKVQGKDMSEESPILTAISNNLILRIKDEDDDLVLIGDQEDLDVAISEALAHNKEIPKMTIFVENTFEAEF